jgi:hypothetical protein
VMKLSAIKIGYLIACELMMIETGH